jgi:hypothetical protein
MAYMDDNEPITCMDCGSTTRIRCPHVPHLSDPRGQRLAARARHEADIRTQLAQLDGEWERLQDRRERRQAMTGQAERLVGGLATQRRWPGY